ncbi:MAG: two-component system, OmpR family, response regulator MprA [Candidatus Eremiobacteraeota bacterium]|nr:two-component system, OmpR family, response regulator MprA [Candidatus Eremiobacteraeota bacterium]MEA2718915.1 two-component system, OmpR family, response regulator MprA [Candidatus Eremiobacteraeota bacterium]
MSNQTNHRVLVVDDERAIRDVVDIALTQAGFLVRTAMDGPDALTAVRDWAPECILLDVMMPKIDGLALIPLLRRLTEVPIIMLTARGDVRDRVAGLEAGADDYLAKPFDVSELIARVNTVLRRPTLRKVNHLRFADLQVDLDERVVVRGDTEIDLSTREFDLLATLMRRPKRVFTREELLDLVWGSDRDVAAATVETYISYLRAKIDRNSEKKLLRTIRGVGYALRDR